MADRWAFVVAIEKHADPALGGVPYAESGAKAVSDALAGAGYRRANQIVLTGSAATRTAVASRLRKLKKLAKRGDEVLAFWAGRGFAHGGAGVLPCWDALPDDLADTSLAVAEFVEHLTATKATQIAVLLDIGAGADAPPAAGDGWDAFLDPAELDRLFAGSAKLVGLRSSDADERSHAAAGLKATAWAHLVAEAIAGRGPKAVESDGRVTALSLHRFLTDELPRILRKHLYPDAAQTPRLLGDANAGFVLAALGRPAADLGAILLDPARLKRVAFRADSTGRFKDLSAYRKSFQIPDNAGPSAKRFVAKLAQTDLRADVDAVFDAAREHLGYKRKDIEVTAGQDGYGFVRGPDFEYTVSASLNPADPTEVLWRREVGAFADPGFVRSPGFDAVFGKLFDQLAFEFAAPVDVSALVDRLEDHPPAGVKVAVASDGKSCDLTLTGFAGRVTVDRTTLVVRGRAGNSAGLLDQFLAFLRTVGPLGEPPALPPAR